MKKIEVKTKCGETFTLEVDTDQEIESMQEVVKVLTESLFNEPQSLNDVRRMVEFLHGGKWRFSTNTSDKTYAELKKWVNTEPENVVIVPWAFYGSYRYHSCSSRQRLSTDNIRMGGSSVWVRCLR